MPGDQAVQPGRGAVIGRLQRRPPQPYQEKQEREEESRRGDDDKRDESAPGSGGNRHGPPTARRELFHAYSMRIYRRARPPPYRNRKRFRQYGQPDLKVH